MNLLKSGHGVLFIEIVGLWLRMYPDALRGRLVQELLWKEAKPGELIVLADENLCGLVGVVGGQVALRLESASWLFELRQHGFRYGHAVDRPDPVRPRRPTPMAAALGAKYEDAIPRDSLGGARRSRWPMSKSEP